MTKDLVIFDLDGTLVQFDFTAEGMRSVRSNLQSLFAEVGVERDFKPLLIDLTDALETVSETVDEDTAARVRDEAFQQLEAMERDAVSRQHVYESSNAVLEQIDASDAVLAVATNNTREAAKVSIDAAGFPEPDYLVAVDDVAQPKPDPAMIDVLLDRFNLSPASMTMIGDKKTDAQSAYQANVKTETSVTTMLINRGGDSEDSTRVDHSVTSLTEISSILQITTS
jgi:phosphoglycolate phosphatase